MPDREKVIKGLEGMIDYFFDIYRNDTDSYKCARAQEYSDCAIDAIALLKEQKAIEPTSYMDGLVQRFACGKCGKHLLYAKWGRDNFCSKCGQAVKWNERNDL